MGENSPLSKADILHALPDDAEVDACQEVRELPLIPTRGRSSLVSRDAASVLVPPGPALVLLLRRLLPPEPVCPLLRPRRFRVSGLPSGRWTMSEWIIKCSELRLIPACTCYFLTFALG